MAAHTLGNAAEEICMSELTVESRCITEPNDPYKIVHVNQAWSETTGYARDEVVGQSCLLLNGAETCKQTEEVLFNAIRAARTITVRIFNYRKDGSMFVNDLSVSPIPGILRPDCMPTHLLWETRERFVQMQPLQRGRQQLQRGSDAGSAPRASSVSGASEAASGGATNATTQPAMHLSQQPLVLLHREAPFPRLITERHKPYRILSVNDAWCEACGERASALVGQPYASLFANESSFAPIQTALERLHKADANVNLAAIFRTKAPQQYIESVVTVAPLLDTSGKETDSLVHVLKVSPSRAQFGFVSTSTTAASSGAPGVTASAANAASADSLNSFSEALGDLSNTAGASTAAASMAAPNLAHVASNGVPNGHYPSVGSNGSLANLRSLRDSSNPNRAKAAVGGAHVELSRLSGLSELSNGIAAQAGQSDAGFASGWSLQEKLANVQDAMARRYLFEPGSNDKVLSSPRVDGESRPGSSNSLQAPALVSSSGNSGTSPPQSTSAPTVSSGDAHARGANSGCGSGLGSGSGSGSGSGANNSSGSDGNGSDSPRDGSDTADAIVPITATADVTATVASAQQQPGPPSEPLNSLVDASGLVANDASMSGSDLSDPSMGRSPSFSSLVTLARGISQVPSRLGLAAQMAGSEMDRDDSRTYEVEAAQHASTSGDDSNNTSGLPDVEMAGDDDDKEGQHATDGLITATAVVIDGPVATAAMDKASNAVRVPPFLTKLYTIVEGRSYDEHAQWCRNGTAFRIHNPNTFAEECLPLFFKHNKMGSFQQQLVTYGFLRIPNKSCLDISTVWQHPSFRQGRSELLSKIVRACNSSYKRPHSERANGTGLDYGVAGIGNGAVSEPLVIMEDAKEVQQMHERISMLCDSVNYLRSELRSVRELEMGALDSLIERVDRAKKRPR